MKKIIVLGAGAIGSVFAALLSKRNDVLLVGRREHVKAINKNGLQLTGVLNENFYLKSATKINKIEANTIIFLTVKAHQTKDAITNIKNKIKPDTIIVCIQNGLGSEKIAHNLVPCKVIRATTIITAMLLKPGAIQIATLAPTTISRDEKQIIEIMSQANIPIQKTRDIKKEIWNKLIINCVINGLGSILRVKNNELQSKYLKKTKDDIIDECTLVAKKEGVLIKKSISTKINKITNSSTGINSTLQDLIRHKKTEIDFINGAIVKLGKEHKIKTPVNEMIWGIIKANEIYE